MKKTTLTLLILGSILLFSVFFVTPVHAALDDLTASDLLLIVKNIGDWIFAFGLAIAVIMILIGAIMFMTAAGDPDRIATARRVFIWTLTGVVIMVLARGILTVLRAIIGA